MKPQTLLKVLLVLSIINAVTNFFYCFNIVVLPSVYGQMPAMIAQYGFSEHISGAMKQIVEIDLSRPAGYHVAMGMLWVFSLTGCILMWKLRRSGFHTYTLSQLLILLVPPLFVDKGSLDIGGLMFTALFVFYYWRLLKILGAFDTPSDSSDFSDSSDQSEASL